MTDFSGGAAYDDTMSALVESMAQAVDPRPSPSRRSRKKSRTYAALVEAGAELFASRGFDETTTIDIAEQADVSQRTLFRHFPSKEAVLYGDMDELLFALRDGLDARPDDEPVLTVVREAIMSLAPKFEEHRERLLLQARLAAAYPSVSAFSRATVQLGWEREIIAATAARLGVDPLDDARPEIIAGATMSAVRIATRQWTLSDGTDDYVQLISAALDSVPTVAELAA